METSGCLLSSLVPPKLFLKTFFFFFLILKSFPCSDSFFCRDFESGKRTRFLTLWPSSLFSFLSQKGPAAAMSHCVLLPPPSIQSLGSSAAADAKSLQSCLTLCNLTDGSPPGSPVPGILQARTLEWVAISVSNAWKWKVKVKSLSRVRL